MFDGQIRETIYDIIFNIDQNLPVVYKTVLPNPTNTHRTSKNISINDSIIHCRCGSVYDETLLIQCYACQVRINSDSLYSFLINHFVFQLWQHAACVTITDPSQPHYCFECHPICEENPLSCLKTNVLIPTTPISNDNHPSYSTITRSDGFIIRFK